MCTDKILVFSMSSKNSSKLDKIVPQTVIRLLKLTDFYQGFIEHVFLQTNGELGIFRVLHWPFGYILGV